MFKFRKIIIFTVFVLCFGWFNIPVQVFADSSEFNNAGLGADVEGVGSVFWQNTNFITIDDTNYASANISNNQTTHYLEGTNYNFNIPEKATIKGITATIYRKSSGSGVRDNQISLIKNGNILSSDKHSSSDWPVSSFSSRSYGGSSDLWGTTWTPEDINSSNFGIAMSVTNFNSNSRIVNVDYIKITVTYFIEDTISPVIESINEIAVPATSIDGAIVNYDIPQATDNIDTNVIVTCLPESGSTFPLGGTIVICNAQDNAGNQAVPKTFMISVYDDNAPSGYTASFDQTEINSSNQSNISFTIHNAEIGSQLYYWIYDGNVIAQEGDREPSHEMRNFPIAVMITSSEQTVSGLDLSNYDLGQIVLVATLVDDSMNFGEDQYAYITKIDDKSDTAILDNLAKNLKSRLIFKSENKKDIIQSFEKHFKFDISNCLNRMR